MMYRLSDRAYKILAKEVNRLITSPVEQVRKDIILRRLTKLSLQEGTPMTYEELKAEIEDIFPEFDDDVIRRAARANQPSVSPGVFAWIGGIAAGAAFVAGGVWVLNLPYPMIRMPVAKVAPIVLLPSFMSMDYHYRQAISLVEQSDQLVNRATSAQDIELGAEKVEASQGHLDQLPVWFLGYYPRGYCSWFRCGWRFTYDEFQTARKSIGRMEAKVFQERNALTSLDEGTDAVELAKQQYQAADATQGKMEAAAAWQTGIDRLNEIPSETLAGRRAQTKLQAYERDFGQIAGTLAGGNRSSTFIAAAQQFAMTASTEAQNAPLPAESWERIANLWNQSIERLERITVEDAGYDEAQRMLAEYQNKLGVVQERLVQEARSQEALDEANDRNTNLINAS